MDEKVLFSAGIRIVGLLSFGRGFLDLLSVIFIELGLSSASVVTDSYFTTLKLGLLYLLIGLYLMRGAKLLVRFAFPGNAPSNENLPDEEDFSAPPD
ncbi:MAG TPA: hypothetical protein VGC76_12110 [Pyrinomonadaceae bacterium]|jgi:hypothetical protein